MRTEARMKHMKHHISFVQFYITLLCLDHKAFLAVSHEWMDQTHFLE